MTIFQVASFKYLTHPKIDGNISVLGETVLGGEPLDEGKKEASYGKGAYVKVLIDPEAVKQNYVEAKGSIESIKESYSVVQYDGYHED